MTRLCAIAAIGLCGLAHAGTASAAEIRASGPGGAGFAYTPADVSATVGETVRWVDVDLIAPHDAVEANDLWRTGVFGPGSAAERTFEAGTFDYYCSIHGAARMSGVVRVAPTISGVERGGELALRVTWAPAPPAQDLVFDVQRRQRGRWRRVLDGTTKTAKTFPGAGGKFRVRLRARSDPSTASGWSPIASRRMNPLAASIRITGMGWFRVLRRVAGAIAVAVAVPALLAGSARAATLDVTAAGNVFTGGLGFFPADIEAAVGDTVRWTNTDFLVPHTATEDHSLFDLGGDYGQTPLNPPGFGPGDTRERVFEAGTFEYFCEVHPQQMRGVVTVAPLVKAVRAGGKRRLIVTWATAPPAAGQVFDVERRGKGDWKLVRDGTSDTSGTFSGKRATFRVRLRSASDPTLASEYSPPVKA